MQLCRTCQMFNSPIRRTVYGSFIRGTTPGEVLHLDIVIPLRGINIVVLMDRFSQLVQLRRVAHTTGEAIVHCLEE